MEQFLAYYSTILVLITLITTLVFNVVMEIADFYLDYLNYIKNMNRYKIKNFNEKDNS